MYEKYFYLKEKPFHITPDPRFLYLGSKHREAIELLAYGISGKKGFIMLTGEVGTGKTTLSRAFLDKLPKKTASALILNPVLSELDLLKTITDDFGLGIRGNVKEHLDGLNAFLMKNALDGITTIVIIDEAQNLPLPTMEMLRLLSNIETQREKLLQIVLVGQPELKEKLLTRELRQLNQRVIARYHLEPLDRPETEAYINNRLMIAGANGNVRFTADALDSVHLASTGIPRIINIICDRALTAAFIADKRVVDIEIIARAVYELEDEGYLKESLAQRCAARFLPHIAVSTLAAGIAAGLRWGTPLIQRMMTGATW